MNTILILLSPEFLPVLLLILGATCWGAVKLAHSKVDTLHGLGLLPYQKEERNG
jgi:hypothetical protein